MTRDVTPEVDAAASADRVRPFGALALDFPSAVSTVNSTARDLTFATGAAGFGTLTFRGVGDLGAISTIKETLELGANDVTLQLSGIPVANISAALSENYQRRKAFIWRGYLDANYQVIADPVIIYRGLIDTMDIARGKQAVITVKLNSRFADWERPRVRRYNDADQQSRYPGDRFFEFIEQMEEKELDW